MADRARSEVVAGLLRSLNATTAEAARDDERQSTFARGLVLGALVGAAIAGSTIWQRRRTRDEAPAPATPRRAARPGPLGSPGSGSGLPARHVRLGRLRSGAADGTASVRSAACSVPLRPMSTPVTERDPRIDPLPAAEIRRRFLEFFAERGHTVVPSASLVPAGDADAAVHELAAWSSSRTS